VLCPEAFTIPWWWSATSTPACASTGTASAWTCCSTGTPSASRPAGHGPGRQLASREDLAAPSAARPGRRAWPQRPAVPRQTRDPDSSLW